MQVNTISEDFEDQMGWKKVFASIHISLRSFSLKPGFPNISMQRITWSRGIGGG